MTLDEIAEIRMGHGFRGAVVTSPEAETNVIQMRDVDLAEGVMWEQLETCHLVGRKEPVWLQPGDIIFQARGRRNFALHLPELPFDSVVCTQHFLVVRIKDERFAPGFVAWLLNQTQAQRHFDMSAPDSHNRNITITTLATAPISHVSIETQHQLGALIELTRKEKRLYDCLMLNREQQLSALASQILLKEEDA